ncbi:MAG: hypothetical protein ACRDHF_13010, partial [Tepidiformaceae bacterium]
MLSIGALIGSAVALGVVLIRAADDASVGTADPAGAADDATRALTYSGPLPAGLAGAGLRAATAPSDADFVFERSTSPDAIAVRYYVPVASLATALDGITSAELRGLLSAELALADAGGLGGKSRYMAVDVDADRELVASFLPAAPEVVPGGYDALLAEVASSDDAIAVIPLDLVTPAVSALAVDGIDIVRGRGDAAAWPFVERVTIDARTGRARDQVAALRVIMTAALPRVTHVVATGDILQARCSL